MGKGKVVITGVAGFVGSSICDFLLSEGYEVVGVDCFTSYYDRSTKESNLVSALSHSGFTLIESDLCKIDMMNLVDGAQIIFHQAAQAGVRASWGDYFQTYVDCNITATQKLLDALRLRGETTRVVYASSSSIYGNAESFPTHEDTVPRPVSPYGVTKLAAENLMGLYASESGISTVSLRYFTVYGPRQRPDMAFNRFCKAALLGEEITIYGDGEQARDFTFISDIVAGNIAAGTVAIAPGSIYNLGGGSVVTVNEVLAIFRDLVGTVKVRYLDRQLGDARKTSADTSRAARALGFSPKVALREGIERELKWMESQIRAK